jgi:CTP synthase (UTP-ammonia lyase)
MPEPLRIGLIGDYSPHVRAHVLIPEALTAAGAVIGREVEPHWLSTESIADDAEALLSTMDALWCVPGSPYRSMAGSLGAIRFARERGVPFLGTCGGFQHALLEYARDVIGIADADHAESSPGGKTLIITPLACSLVGHTGKIFLKPGSRAARIYGKTETTERFHCNYGLDARYRSVLDDGALSFTGSDEHGEARVVELSDHPFFMATLFQPELSHVPGTSHPVISTFVASAHRLQRLYNGSASRRPP